MKEIITVAQCAFAAMGGALGAVLGGWDGFLYALIMFTVIDYLTGVMVAIAEKTLSSEVGFKGIAKKVAVFCLVAVAHIIDAQFIKNGAVVRTATVFFYLSNEGISIIENVAKLGLPVPEKLKNVLEQLKTDSEE